MAMAMSLGKRSRRTKACNIVETSRAVTVSIATTESVTERVRVTIFVTTFEYLMVAVAATVMGKVYAHQANENL